MITLPENETHIASYVEYLLSNSEKQISAIWNDPVTCENISLTNKELFAIYCHYKTIESSLLAVETKFAKELGNMRTSLQNDENACDFYTFKSRLKL